MPWLLTLILLALSIPATAQQAEVTRAIHDADVAASAVAEHQPTPSDPQAEFDAYVARQAGLEVQLGLRMYAEFDDFRAITAFRRYQLLQPESAKARFIGSLMIGQIYHRNDKPELSTLAFENAARAAETPYHRTFAYLLGLQQVCLPLSLYVQCRHRLVELTNGELEPELRELVQYQIMYTDVVLRQDGVDEARAQSFESETLRVKAATLVEQDRAFDELRLKRPWLAGTMSAVVPGVGQFYNGRPVDGLLALGVTGAFGVGTYFAFAEAKSISLGVILALLTAGFYSGNIVNAVVDARKINARRYLKFFERLKAEHWPRVAFVIDEDEVLFTYGFDWPGPVGNDRGQSKE